MSTTTCKQKSDCLPDQYCIQFKCQDVCSILQCPQNEICQNGKCTDVSFFSRYFIFIIIGIIIISIILITLIIFIIYR